MLDNLTSERCLLHVAATAPRDICWSSHLDCLRAKFRRRVVRTSCQRAYRLAAAWHFPTMRGCPRTIRTLYIAAGGGFDNVTLETTPAIEPGPGAITVRLRASSLNYHDLGVVSGAMGPTARRIPMSDGAGEVTAVGEGVREFAVGDDVVSTFFPDWLDGEPQAEGFARTPGDGIDGYAREQVTAPEPGSPCAARWSHAEAATLTTAGLTAWRALFEDGGLRRARRGWCGAAAGSRCSRCSSRSWPARASAPPRPATRSSSACARWVPTRASTTAVSRSGACACARSPTAAASTTWSRSAGRTRWRNPCWPRAWAGTSR